MTIINYDDALSTGKRFASKIRSEIDNNAQVVLFGSCAKNKATERSDIDIAVISEKFGHDIMENFARLTVLAYGINTAIEPHPFTIDGWKDNTPFILEIQKTGVEL